MISRINTINLNQNFKRQKVQKQNSAQVFENNATKPQELMPYNLASSLKVQFLGNNEEIVKAYEMPPKELSSLYKISDDRIAANYIHYFGTYMPVYFNEYTPFDSMVKNNSRGKFFKFVPSAVETESLQKDYGYVYITDDGNGIYFPKDVNFVDKNIFKNLDIEKLKQKINEVLSLGEKYDYDSKRNFCPVPTHKITNANIQIRQALERELIQKYIKQGAIALVRSHLGKSENKEWLKEKIKDDYGVSFYIEYPADLDIDVKTLTNFDFKEAQKEIEKSEEEKLKNANLAVNERLSENNLNNHRFLKFLFTLGISEIYRDYKRTEFEKDYKDTTKEETNQAQIDVLNKQESNLPKIENTIEAFLNFEKKKEGIKNILKNRYIDKVNERNPHMELPNCVMFEGPNYILAEDFAKWSAKQTRSNFELIGFDFDNNKVQEKLYNALEKSLNDYEKSEDGRRTIIYVESMERLLDPRFNSNANIAIMKEFMQCANEDYHATIMFNTAGSCYLNRESRNRNRVGLIVDVPITYEEANLKKRLDEEVKNEN